MFSRPDQHDVLQTITEKRIDKNHWLSSHWILKFARVWKEHAKRGTGGGGIRHFNVTDEGAAAAFVLVRHSVSTIIQDEFFAFSFFSVRSFIIVRITRDLMKKKKKTTSPRRVWANSCRYSYWKYPSVRYEKPPEVNDFRISSLKLIIIKSCKRIAKKCTYIYIYICVINQKKPPVHNYVSEKKKRGESLKTTMNRRFTRLWIASNRCVTRVGGENE